MQRWKLVGVVLSLGNVAAQGDTSPPPVESPPAAEPAPAAEPVPEIRAAPAQAPIIVVPAQRPIEVAPEAPPPEADVTGAYGFQVMGQGRLLDGTITAPPATVGLRRWSEDHGYEIGLGLSVLGDDGDVDTTAGLIGGYMHKLSEYPNMTVFVEPQVGAWIIIPSNDGDKTYALNLRLSLGAEVRLGMIDLPRIGLTTRVSAGIDALHENNSDLTLIGTGGGINNGIQGLIEGTFGFVIYI